MFSEKWTSRLDFVSRWVAAACLSRWRAGGAFGSGGVNVYAGTNILTVTATGEDDWGRS
jgi:hypothetical protein